MLASRLGDGGHGRRGAWGNRAAARRSHVGIWRRCPCGRICGGDEALADIAGGGRGDGLRLRYRDEGDLQLDHQGQDHGRIDLRR
jgi:hypothetical protein